MLSYLMIMSLEEYAKERLWQILVDTVHALTMYTHHKAYVRDTILHEKPDITPSQLSAQLGIPLGEALVVIFEIAEERKGMLNQ